MSAVIFLRKSRGAFSLVITMGSLVYFGGAIKALDENGKIGGYLVRFSDDGSQKDLAGEYFTSKTFLGSRDGDGVDTMFHHGQPIPVKSKLTKAAAAEIKALQDHVFAPVKTKRDTIGIFAETVLDMADEYEKAVFGLVKAGKLGWSSGAVSHLVKKSSDGQIKRWPIGEASITPTPCEPLNRALTIKSLDSIKFVSVVEDDEDPAPQPIADKPAGLAAKLNQHIEDLADDKGRTREAIIKQMAREAGVEVKTVEAILANAERPTDARLKAFARALNVSFDALKAAQGRDHLQTIKGMFEEALAEQTPSRWELESTYCRIIKKLAQAASAAQMAGVTFDLEAKIKEATDEYTSLLRAHALAQIESWIEAGGDDDFYLKAILDTAESVKALASTDLDTHLQLAESVNRGLYSRFRAQHEARKKESSRGNRDGQKAGRVLSEKNRTRLAEFIKQILAVASDAQSLLDESQPMASDEQKRAAQTKYLMSKHRLRAAIGA